MSAPPTAATTYFEGANHCTIGSVQINEVLSGSQASSQVRTLNILSPQAGQEERQVLYSKVVPGAIHDSNERCDAPKCHAETRKAVQEDVIGWIRHGEGDDEPMRIMWITGPAGSGKTAIVGSVAETCDKDGLLAATFFFSSFSGSEGRRLKRGLVTTLAYQLTQLDGMEGFEADVLSTIRRNPAVFDARLQKQVEILILRPLRNRQASGAPPISAQVVIIDGLDEVEAPASRQLAKEDARLRNEADQVEILCALRHATNDPAFPFRILIASRPERVIRVFFSGDAGGTSCRKISLQDQYNADADIRLFLNAKFAEIRRRYRLSLSWPAQETLEKLVETASGQFVYAATVIRFLQDGKAPNPQASLLKVLNWRSLDEGAHGLEPLDALYTRIIGSSRDPRLATQWLRIIHDYRLSSETALFVKQLLQDYEGQAEELLEDLASLIDIPSSDLEEELPYKFYHKSLEDFLSSSWSERLFPQDDDLFLAQRCVEIFRSPSLAVSHSDAKCRTFVKTLFGSSLFDEVNFFGLFNAHRDRYVLPLCDAEWWVRWALSDSQFARRCLCQLFIVAHLKCGNWDFRDCTEACKHWRSTILRIGQDQEFRVPDVFGLLVMKFVEADNQRYSPSDFAEFFDLFGSPKVVKILPPPTLSSFTSPANLQTLDADYEKMCATVDYMRSSLPDGWGEKFGRNLERIGFEYARLEVKKQIVRKMGLQLEVTGYRSVDLSTDDIDRYVSYIFEDDTDDEANDPEDENDGKIETSDDDGMGNFGDETSGDKDASAKEDVGSRGKGGANTVDWGGPGWNSNVNRGVRMEHPQVMPVRQGQSCAPPGDPPGLPGVVEAGPLARWNFTMVTPSNNPTQSLTPPLNPELWPFSNGLAPPFVPDVLADFYSYPRTGFLLPMDLLIEELTRAYGDRDYWVNLASFSLPPQDGNNSIPFGP